MDNWFTAAEAMERLLADYKFQTVLDIGSGQGLHADKLRSAGKTVIALEPSDHWHGRADVRVPFEDFKPTEPFDVIWAAHVLEHQLNVNFFLRRVFELLKPGGIFVVTVPPWKTSIVGGHVTIWNAGLLFYNLIMAGFDCREARAGRYDYNISVMVRKRHAALPPLRMDRGDIEVLAPYFPLPVQQDFDGEINALRWSLAEDRRPVAGSALGAGELTIEHFRDLQPFATDEANLRWSAAVVGRPGPVAEFGVFKGRSLRVLAEELPYRRIAGLDSFRGLPEAWVRSDTSTYGPGHFALTELPSGFPDNVQLYPGFFRDTLPLYRDTLSEPLALVHIDADLYSSARDVLFGLDAFIVKDTVLVFDELCDFQGSGTYPKWAEGEWRALNEWLAATGRRVRVLSRGPDFAATVVVA